MHVRRLLDSGYWEQEDDFSFAIPILMGKGVFLISSVKSKYFLHKANTITSCFLLSWEHMLKPTLRAQKDRKNFQMRIQCMCISRYS